MPKRPALRTGAEGDRCEEHGAPYERLSGSWQCPGCWRRYQNEYRRERRARDPEYAERLARHSRESTVRRVLRDAGLLP